MSVTTDVERAASWLKLGQPVIVAKRNPSWSPAMPGREFLFPRNWQSIGPDDCDLSSYREGDALIAPCGWTFDVIDIDTKLGGEVTRASVPAEIECFGEHRTPSGGYHLFVKKLGYSKNNNLTFSGVHVGDYLAGTDTGAGRAFVYLPGTSRPRYNNAGYQVMAEVDLEKLIDSDPDPILESVVMRCGSSRDGEAGRQPVGDAELQEFFSSFKWQRGDCGYGRGIANEMSKAIVPRGSRHNWYVRSMMRIVELVKTGCCDLNDIEMLHSKLIRMMPEGGTSHDGVLKYAVANTQPVVGSGCMTHKGKPVILDMSDPAIKERENHTGLVRWAEAWNDYDNTTRMDLVPRIIQEGSSVSFYSPAGAGKSLLLLEWAVKLARGEELMGQRRPPVKIMYIDQENSLGEVMSRLESMGYGPEDDLSNLRYHSLGQWPPLNTQEGADMMVGEIIRTGTQVVFLDTLSKFFDGNENESEPFITMNRLFGVRLRRVGVTIIRLDHSGKDATRGARGASAKEADLDTTYALTVTPTSVDGESTVLLVREKDRLGYGHKEQITFLRKREPITAHELVMDATGMQRLDRIEVLVQEMDRLGVPLEAGRRIASERLREADIRARNDLILDAIRTRRNRMELRSPTSGTTPLSPRVGDQPGPLPPKQPISRSNERSPSVGDR